MTRADTSPEGPPEVSLPMEESIVAVSTAPGRGAISIIRVSGPRSLAVASRVFRRSGGKGFPGGAEERRLVLGHAVEPGSGAVIDEVLLAAMYGPHTYTGEDLVEFHCHGSWVVQRAVMRALLAAGARPAEPGEFTKRAFLNGRLDLAQAEAVADLIAARSQAALQVALRQMEGGLSERVRGLRHRLVEELARVEAQIDFSEEDVGGLDRPSLARDVEGVAEELETLIATGLQARYLQEGIRVAIVGRPNVGKSSLLNALVMRERAIVSEMPGTTRDSIEEMVEIAGLPVTLVDTAGLRSTEDRLEQLGVERTESILRSADVVLVVADLSRVECGSAAKATGRTGVSLVPEAPPGGWDAGRTIVVANKLDLVQGRSAEAVAGLLAVLQPGQAAEGGGWGGALRCCPVSALTEEGLSELRECIRDLVMHGTGIRPHDVLLTTERQVRLAEEAAAAARAAADGLRSGRREELVAEDVRAAVVSLGRITGEEVGEEVLDEVFRRFCIGK